jgi:hypothetical protein
VLSEGLAQAVLAVNLPLIYFSSAQTKKKKFPDPKLQQRFSNS